MKEDSVSELELCSKIVELWRSINKYAVDSIKKLLQQFFSCVVFLRINAVNKISYSIIILYFEWKIVKFQNVWIFQHYKIRIMASKKEGNHYALKEIETYCRTKTFPKRPGGKGSKINFRWTAKRFSIKNGQLYYKESRLVIADKDRQANIIHNIHKRSGDTSHSKAVSAHLGRTPT